MKGIVKRALKFFGLLPMTDKDAAQDMLRTLNKNRQLKPYGIIHICPRRMGVDGTLNKARTRKVVAELNELLESTGLWAELTLTEQNVSVVLHSK